MPQEPLPPWDRRDFRRHDRSGSDPRFGGAPNRWRDHHTHAPPPPPPHAPPPYQQYNRQQQQRWYSDFRSSRPVPPGHGKQGGWHMYADEAGHGFPPFGSRFGDRNFEDENCRPFVSRGEGRYFRNIRENRGSFTWKKPSQEPAASPISPGKPIIKVNLKRPVEDSQKAGNDNSSRSIDSSSPLLDSSNPLSPKEPHDKNGCTADLLASRDQKVEKENGLGPSDWKPLKWSRTGSLSSRSSIFSHSSSSKSMGVDSVETVAEVQLKKVTPFQSPHADAIACVMSSAPDPLDETCSRKKPRLGWGEGLAKFEKKIVEGPEGCTERNEPVVSVSDTIQMQSHAVNLLNKSPTVACLSDCASPATPSSVACSSSPGVEEKDSFKAVHNTTNLICSPSNMSQTQDDGPSFNLETLNLTTIARLSTLIDELLHSKDPGSVEPGFMQNFSLSKLLVWKAEMLKALEITESEIESFETELKSLITEPRCCCPPPASSSSIPEEPHSNCCEDQFTDSQFAARISHLQVVSSGDMIVENTPVSMEDEHALLKEKDVDSPGSATSKFVEALPVGEDIFNSEASENVEKFLILKANNFSNLDEKSSENGLTTDEENCGHVDNYELSESYSSEDLDSDSDVCSPVDDVFGSIVVGNKYFANSASEELNKLLPIKQGQLDISTASSVSSWHSDSLVVAEKFLRRKKFLQFKEKAIALKFKVFRHFWKAGRPIYARKVRIKSYKKFDLSQPGDKKNRLFSRSRTSSFAGSARTVPADEVLEFVNVLLSETPFKPYRNSLKMPALNLDNEIKMSRFISNSGLVEDPCAVEKERSIISQWTSEETEIFIDNLAIFGKDFRKIASFLDHKTVADCIEFYYKNHKSECFERARKKPDYVEQRKSQSITYLVASGKRRNREMNAASLDMLGAASAIAANVDGGIESQQKCTSRYLFGASSSYRTSRDDYAALQRSNSLDTYSNERETAAADVLAGICGSMSSETMGSCISSSVDPGEGYQERRCQRVGSATIRPLTPEVTQNVDDESSDESCGEMDPTDWTDEEKSIFIQAVSSYGMDFVMISQSVRTRSIDQCKVFFSKARKCLGLDLITPGACNTISGDDGGDGDIEDACVVETGSDICNGGSGCKIEDDVAPTNMNLNYELDIALTENLKPDFKIHEENNEPCPLDPMAAEPILNDLLTGDNKVDDKPATNFNVNSEELNGVSSECVSTQELGNMGVSSNIEAAPVEVEDDHGLPNSLSEADKRNLVGVSNGHCSDENEGQGPLSPEDKLKNEKTEDGDCSSMEVSGRSSAVSEMKPGTYVSHHSFGVHSSMQVVKVSDCQKKVEFESFSVEKSCAMPLQQNGHLASVKPSTLFTVPIKYQRSSTRRAISAVASNGIYSEHFHKTVRTCDSQQHLSGFSLSDPFESSHILKGHPVTVQTLKETNGDANFKRSIPLQNVSRRGRMSHSDFSLQKCNGLRHQTKMESLFTSCQEQSKDYSRPKTDCSSDADKLSRNGDVKLFGKILVSSHQKPNSSVQQVDSKAQHHKAGYQPLDLKIRGASMSNFDRNNYIASENTPVRNFGFRDGNHIQTGFPPLSDSALLLAKYPSAFGSYAMPTMKLGQPPLHGVVKSNNHPSNGVSGFPNWDLSSNRDVQPFTIDMKQPQDVLFSEMQRINGFDLVSGMQPQARGTMGINVGR